MSQPPHKSPPRRPLPSDEIVLHDREVAEMLGVALDTVLKWRRCGGGPPFSRVLKTRAVYLRTRLLEWLDSRAVYDGEEDEGSVE